MEILLQLVYSGIALGMIYAVIAFGYQLTFQTSDTLNFGQGDALMLGALVGLTLVGLGVNYWLMIPLVCLFGAFQGAVVERIGVRPRVVGEFEDSALLATFGAAGMGVFPAAELIHDKLTSRYDVKRLGPCDGVEEHFFAMGTDKKVLHPLVQRLLPGKRT